MANERDNQGGEGRQSEFDREKKNEFSKGQQGQQGQAGTDREPGFVGSQGKESGEYLQEGGPKQAGFAEQGRGAPDEGRDIERGGERTANRDSDIEGSSEKDC